MIYYMFSYRYYLKKRDTLATVIQDEVQQVHRVIIIINQVLRIIQIAVKSDVKTGRI